MNSTICRLGSILVAAALSGGCLGDPSADTGTTREAIINGQAAQDWMRRRVATLGNCTAVIVGPRHLLTAAHCKKAVGNSVRFFDAVNADGQVLPNTDEANRRTITAVALRPGVDPVADDFRDVNGDFADVAVLTIDAPAPAFTRVTAFALSHPSVNITAPTVAFAVGRGGHTPTPNTNGRLEFASNVITDGDVSDGRFETMFNVVNPGDSGGPILHDRKLLGVLWGHDGQGGNLYTSTVRHLGFILDRMGFTESTGYAVLAGRSMSGTSAESLVVTERRRCALACTGARDLSRVV